MYNAGKIIAGIILFVIIATSPLWYNVFTGKEGFVPELKLPVEQKQCIENTAYMKANHTDLLNKWKDNVVRKGMRTYTAQDGKIYTASLTMTCMKCHSNKAEFCDRCHNYAGITPKCWDCHNIPKVATK